MRLLFPTNILLEIKNNGLGKIAPKGTRLWIDRISVNTIGKQKCGSGVMLHAYEINYWLDSGWFKDLPHINICVQAKEGE
jgi:hypothetical protein